MATWRVVMTDNPFPTLEPARAELAAAGAELVLAQPGGDALPALVGAADALLTTYAPVDAGLIARMQRCRIIARCGIGVDNVDVEASTRRGIWVTNVPDYCMDEVSDHTLALVLSLLRKVVVLNTLAHAGSWSYAPARPIHALEGLTLGLVGFGQIGQRVGVKARAFGFHVVAHDPYIPPAHIQQAGAVPLPLDDLLRASDVVSIHVPLTPATRHLVDGQALARMKPGAFLVNTSRGGIVDEAALRDALDAGHLAGAALDVLEREGSDGESPLRGHPNVILTPHVAFYSERSVVELQRKAARQVVKVLSGMAPDYPVNRPAGAA